MTTMDMKVLFFISLCLSWTASWAQDICGSSQDTPCPRDMTHFDGNCYKFNGQEQNIVYGVSECYSIESHLPYITSQAQQEFLLELTGNTSILLGLTQNDAVTPWEWWDGGNDTYRNFGLILDYGLATFEKDCSYISYNHGIWREDTCYKKHRVLCQIPVQANGSCPGTITNKFQEMCYLESNQTMNFTENTEFCEKEGANMITIPNKDVDDYLFSLVNSLGASSIWIGLYQRDNADEFLWGDGTNADGFHKWAEGQPDDEIMAQDCVALNPDGLWYDENCSRRFSLVCQKAVTCKLPLLDPTWLSVSRMAAAVDEEVKVTCQDGMFHPVLWTKHFYLTCISEIYSFQSCDKCIAGCKLDTMFGSNNIIPPDQRGLLEGETLTLECRCEHTLSNGENTQDISCENGLLSTVETCILSTDGTGSTEEQDRCQWPFMYGACTQAECITTNNNGIPWCNTVDGGWMNCEQDSNGEYPTAPSVPVTTIDGCGTDPGGECVFPFKYDCSSYSVCTSADYHTLWCNTANGWGCCP